jgi:pseudaminic acid biosynthesis-associated methylase
MSVRRVNIIYAVASHDAGGAELLSSYIIKNKLTCRYSLSGPAVEIFRRKLGTFENMSLNQTIETSQQLICGTSWESTHEIEAIGIAREQAIPSSAFLDHWYNYSERFTRGGNSILPDQIIVTDSLAMKKARRAFPAIPIIKITNPYLSELKKEISRLHRKIRKRNEEGVHILYVCEPTSAHAKAQHGDPNFWGYTEKDALKYTLDNIFRIYDKISIFTLRPHPSDPPGKYDSIIKKSALPISYATSSSLSENIANADVVIGCNSMALVVSLLTKKKTICSIPPIGPNCLLPFPKIIMMRDMIKNKTAPQIKKTTKKTYRTEQEEFWAGEFCLDYIKRNENQHKLASKIQMFVKALDGLNGLDSCIEFGANIGLNFRALQLLCPKQEQFGVEINREAARQLCEVIPPENVYTTSILDFNVTRTWDLVLIAGVLIHINPDVLPIVYEKLVSATKRYMLIADYYNPTPVTVPYRGHPDVLFKRDFAGEIMEKFPEMKLVNYGFLYHRDPLFPHDDITWFLMEKRK